MSNTASHAIPNTDTATRDAQAHAALNLRRTAHYQRLLAGSWLPANFAPMPGYAEDNGISEVCINPYSFDALHKITRGDIHNVSALLAAALTVMTHYYGPADYPLNFGLSLTCGKDDAGSDLILSNPAADPAQSGAQLMVEQRQKILEALDLGRTHFQNIEQDAGGTQALFGILLSVRADGAARRSRHAGALQIDFDLAAEGKITLLAEARQWPARYRASILSNFVHLIEQIVATPKQPLCELALSAPQEQQQVLAFAQGPKCPYSDQLRLEHTLAQRAGDMPHKLAVISEEGSLSYQELNQRANNVAWNLIERGVQPGDMVAVMVTRGPAMLAAIYGILKAGAAYVPVDPNYPENRRTYILEDSAARLVLVDSNTAVPAAMAHKAHNLDHFAATARDTENPVASRDAHAVAYMIYTSGSTGNPKGVMIEHHSVFNRIEWMQNQYHLSSDDVILQKTPISFDVSVWELFWWAFVGATVSLLKPNGEKEPAAILATIARDAVSHMHFVPSMLDAFLNFMDGEATGKDTASLKIVFTSGEALTLHQAERFFAQIGNRWHSRLVNLYGPTEATVDVTYYECRPGEQRGSVPIGRPIQNTGILILDSGNRATPVGVAGELCISGVNLARGYLNRPELTAEKFCELPAPLAQRVYRTGDLVRWLVDGEIEYLGRIDHQVKIRGYRIELGEIENAILRCEHVSDTRVIARAREDGSKFLTAYIVPGAQYSEQQTRSTLLARLPEFMVPPYFVALPEFPLTPNGKLDRAKLPDPHTVLNQDNKVLPNTPAEIEMARIWSEVLGIKQIGIHDSFFSLGGDSITSLGVISRARKIGLEISFQQLFSHPTIAALLCVATRAGQREEQEYRAFSLLKEEDRARVPQGIVDAYPLSVLQAGLIFQSELQKGASLYHDIQVYLLDGQFNAQCFTGAMARMVKEHPILRTSYHLNRFDEFVQFVHEDTPLPLYIADWRALDAPAQAARLEEFIEQESHLHFDWSEPGLIRIHIQVLSDQSFRYILSFHDSALDGWSINLFHSKLLRYYHLALSGTGGDLSVSDFDDNFLRKYVALERSTRVDPAAQAFWQQALASYEPMPLPRLKKKSGALPVIEYSDVDISGALSDAIRQLAGSLGVPVKTVLLAAHVRVLSLIANTRQVVTGYEHSGRPEEENVGQAIGLFLNSLPFMLTLNPDDSWRALILRVHHQEAAFLPYRRYPMADMKIHLNTTETLFESVFNFTHFHMLKQLQTLPGMNALNVRVRAETEFVLRAEFSQNAYTDQVQLSLHYHSNEFDAAHVARMGLYYLAALQAMVDHGDTPCLQANILPMEEHALLATAGCGSLVSLPTASVPETILSHGSARAQQPAIRDERRSLSFADFVNEAQELSRQLLANGGIASGSNALRQSVVALAMPRSAAWISAMVAVMAAGGVYLPLDIDSPDARILDLLNEAGISAVVCDPGQMARMETLCQGFGRDIVLAPHPALTGAGANRQLTLTMPTTPSVQPNLPNLAYVLFTSGSTGKPKGALLEHGGMLNHMLAKIADLGLNDKDVLAQTAPVTFDVSIWQALTGLYLGAQTVVYSKDAQLDVAGFCRQLEQDKVTLLEIVPSYFAILLDYLEQQPQPLTHLHTLIQTGEALKHELVARWFSLYPQIRLVNAYGPTEASDDITHHIFRTSPTDAIVPVGKPVQNLRIHILNAEDQPVPFGTAGEICVSGIGVGRGYLNNAEKTAAAFDFAHPLASWSNGRLYRTGDIGKWLADSTLAYMGRKDEQVKIRGMRIEIGEIENTLLTIAGVSDAAVVLQPRPAGARLVGFIAGTSDVEAILAQAATLLPDYMLPEQLIHCTQLPVTAANKVDKKALLKQCETSTVSISPQFHALTTPLEIELAALWAKQLGIPQAQIGKDSHFFHLGGNSLLAMSLAMRSGGRITIADMFATKTLARLAARIEQQGNSDNHGGKHGACPILHELTSASDGPVVVCFSYAGGNAVNFQGVADALGTNTAIQLLAVEPPGNDPSSQATLIDSSELVARTLAELQQKGITRFSVWGHCSGTGAASSLAKQARVAGLTVDNIIVSGKVLRPLAVLDQQIAQTREMSDGNIINWLKDVTGLDLNLAGQAGLEQAMANAYRNDAIGANLLLKQLWQNHAKATPSTTPATLNTGSTTQPAVHCLLAEDDPLTHGSEHLAQNWRLLSDNLSCHQIGSGGHYFLKTRAMQVASLLQDWLQKLD